MKTVAAIQSNYLPWKGYFDLIHDADEFVFYDEVQYTKNDWRNRNRIYSKNRLQWITIPIPDDAVKRRISEVEIRDPYWQEKHYKSVYFAYKGAPHFDAIEPLLKEFYLERRWTHLAELNRHTTRRIAELLGIRTRFLESKDHSGGEEGGRVERLITMLKRLGATRYITGPRAKEYFTGQETLFSDAGIEVVYKDYSGYPEYPQLCGPYIHEVSVLDLLANVGVERAGDHIWSWREALLDRKSLER